VSRVTIGPLNLRDITFLGANMRAEDRREIMCQAPKNLSGSQAAAAMFPGLAPDWTWLASLDGNPAVAFGLQPYNVATMIGWAWGTRHLPRCIPAITRHLIAEEPLLIASGFRRIEVRTIKDHDISHRWLYALGARKECDLPEFGRDGETFELWAWTLHGPRPVRRHHAAVQEEARHD
jgi:hypothetical protein